MTSPTTVTTAPPRPDAVPEGERHAVAVVTLGCARNEVDSEELAGRLSAGGFRLVADPAEADSVLVNTCGFVEAAKKDSVDTLLAAADLKEQGRPTSVVAVGCLAERYGAELAESLPEADAVLGFDDYDDIADRLRGIAAGERRPAHVPADRRRLLPISPVDRTAPAPVARRRLDEGPLASLKLASGCDRRCTFCAIPAFRGSFVSRRPSDVLQDAVWLAGEGARELFLVSENSTSYGKDLGDLRLLETLLPELAAVDGVERVRVSYLQPAETRPGLVEAIAATPGVAPYFDLSFQHASPTVLRRMRRFGDPDSFLGLLEQVRDRAPLAGVRSNVIVGFPGESESDLATLTDFLVAARLDVVGVFGYSDEDGTEAEGFADKHDEAEVAARVAHVTDLVEQLVAQRAEERVARAGRGPGRARRGRAGRGTRGPPGARGRRHLPGRGPPRDGARGRPGRRHRHRERGRRPRRRRPRAGERAVTTPDAPARVSNWNLPNALTTLRIAMVPFFGWALLVDGGESLVWRSVAFVLFALAMITDKIDGDLARARNMVTDFGKIADPIADKALTGMAFIGLSVLGDVWWWVTVVVLLREWSVTLLRLSVLKRIVIAAADLGKWKTTFQALALGGLCLPLRDPDLAGALEVPALVLFYAFQVCLTVAVALTLWSGWEFFRGVWRQRHELGGGGAGG